MLAYIDKNRNGFRFGGPLTHTHTLHTFVKRMSNIKLFSSMRIVPGARDYPVVMGENLTKV